MSILKIKSRDFELELTTDENGVCEVKTSDGVQPQIGNLSVDVALIALALDSYKDASSMHDEESGRITIRQYRSEWNSKAFGLNRGVNK